MSRTRVKVCAGVASAGLAIVLSACGQSDADKATQAARHAVTSFVRGDTAALCAALTPAGEKSVEAVAQGKPQSAQVVGCEANARFVRDGTPAAKRKLFAVDGDPDQVQVSGNRATVRWKCCTFRLQKVGDAFKVADATSLGRYFDVAGAGEGPSGQSAKDVVPGIKLNLRGTKAGRAVVAINVQATRVTLKLKTAKGLTTICETVAGDSLFTGITGGLSELLLATPDGQTHDCKKLLEAAGL